MTEQIQDEKPHLILLDIKLPGENGFALCSKIRTFSEVPIIFVTSCNTDMDELNSITGLLCAAGSLVVSAANATVGAIVSTIDRPVIGLCSTSRCE